MKSLKFVIFIFILALLITFIPACATAEPEVIEEAAVEEETIAEEPEVVEEPAVEEEILEEPEEEVLQEEPELVWSVPHENGLNSIAASPDGETVAVGEFKVTYIHHLADGSLVDVIVHEHSVENLDYSRDGSILGAGQGYYGVLLTNTIDGTELISLEHGHNSRLAFSPDGIHIATGDREGIVWLWQFEDGEKVVALENPEIAEKSIQNRWVIAIDYHPSGELLAALHNDNNVYIWDVKEENMIKALELAYKAFSFSPDGEVMAGAVKEDKEYLVRLWNVNNYEQLADISVPGEVLDIAFSPDGGLLSVATFGRPTVPDSLSGTTIWDVQTGTPLHTFDQIFDDPVKEQIAELTFTPDGGHVAVARNDGTLELWRLPGADPIEPPPVDMKEPPPIPGDVLFDTGSSELKANADEILEELASGLYAALPEAKITFIGHTDSRGDAASNLQLSLDRATAVKEWFDNWAQSNGVDSWGLLVDGRGDTELKVPDFDSEGTFLEEAGKLNRRVEIEIET